MSCFQWFFFLFFFRSSNFMNGQDCLGFFFLTQTSPFKRLGEQSFQQRRNEERQFYERRLRGWGNVNFLRHGNDKKEKLCLIQVFFMN